MHHPILPSVRVMDADGNDILKAWNRAGKLHRRGKAALIFEDDIWRRDLWMLDGREHNDEGCPSFTEVHKPSGVTTWQRYSVHGDNHRLDGPTDLRRCWKTQVETYRRYDILGKLAYRVDGPSAVSRDPENGIAYEEKWAQLNELPYFWLHRDRETGAVREYIDQKTLDEMEQEDRIVAGMADDDDPFAYYGHYWSLPHWA